MEEIRELICYYVGQGLKLEYALDMAQISKGSYYYVPSNKRKGAPKSTHTTKGSKNVSNEVVVKKILKILDNEFIDYGYRKVTTLLKRAGFALGKKKVYRLMKENNLLNPKQRPTKTFDKQIIYDKPMPTRPLEIIEIDIKYVYIDGLGRNSYLITLLDVFHREVYNWGLFENMKTKNVIELITNFFDERVIKSKNKTNEIGISFRTDNGCQFTSLAYRDLLDQFKIGKTYIPPATPQLNGHIESYHSTVEKLICDKYDFKTHQQAVNVFKRFIKTYNNIRVLTCLLDYAPTQFLKQWNSNKIGIDTTKNTNKFFFKEEDKKEKNNVSKKTLLSSSLPPPEKSIC
jgi:putative transposase